MKYLWKIGFVCCGLFVVAGCGSPAPTTQKEKVVAKTTEPATDNGHGWWCEEHGVVEEECSICQKKVFKKLKPEEICPKHPDRAKAQCFICNPELFEKYKAVYIAKYGKEPPLPKDNIPGND